MNAAVLTFTVCPSDERNCVNSIDKLRQPFRTFPDRSSSTMRPCAREPAFRDHKTVHHERLIEHGRELVARLILFCR